MYFVLYILIGFFFLIVAFIFYIIILIDIYLIRQKRQRTHVHAAGKQCLGLHYRPRHLIGGHVDF